MGHQTICHINHLSGDLLKPLLRTERGAKTPRELIRFPTSFTNPHLHCYSTLNCEQRTLSQTHADDISERIDQSER